MPPVVQVSTRDALVGTLSDAGFLIDYESQPSRDKPVFIVARKT